MRSIFLFCGHTDGDFEVSPGTYFITRGPRSVLRGPMVQRLLTRCSNYMSMYLYVADFCPGCKGEEGRSQPDYMKPAFDDEEYVKKLVCFGQWQHAISVFPWMKGPCVDLRAATPTFERACEHIKTGTRPSPRPPFATIRFCVWALYCVSHGVIGQ